MPLPAAGGARPGARAGAEAAGRRGAGGRGGQRWCWGPGRGEALGLCAAMVGPRDFSFLRVFDYCEGITVPGHDLFSHSLCHKFS